MDSLSSHHLSPVRIGVEDVTGLNVGSVASDNLLGNGDSGTKKSFDDLPLLLGYGANGPVKLNEVLAFIKTNDLLNPRVHILRALEDISSLIYMN